MKALLLAVVGSIGLIACTASNHVPFKRYQTFHLELRAVCASDVVAAHRVREMKTRKTNPVSYTYGVSKAARNNVPGYTFAGGNLKADIRVEGYTGGAKEEFVVVDRDNMKIGTVHASAAGPDFIEFRNFDLRDGAVGIVLPFSFAPNPKLKITPVGWEAAGAFYRNGAYEYGFRHRTSSDVGDKMVNVGFIPEILPKCK